MKILVTGGYGFVGPKIVHALRARDHAVRALVRDRGRAKTLESWGCELVEGDVTDADSLRARSRGRRVRRPPRRDDQGPPGRLRAGDGARHARPRRSRRGRWRARFVLMSALGTSEENRELVPYYRAKWDMEQAVLASSLEHVIFRPSFVFGSDGGVLPMFMRQVRWSPVTPVVGPGDGAPAADLGRRRRGVLRRERRAHRRLPGRRSSWAGLTRSRGTSSSSASGELWASAGRRCTAGRPHARRRDAHRLAAVRADHARPAEDARRGRRPGLRSDARDRDARRNAHRPRRATPPRMLIADISLRAGWEPSHLGEAGLRPAGAQAVA